MMNDRQEMRQSFFNAWKKRDKKNALSTLEKQLIEVIALHPEYHSLLENPQNDQDYSTDNNPFLHLGLHVSLQEQLSTDRPAGIQKMYQQLSHQLNDPHRAAHLMMDVMAHILWDAQENGQLPDETLYLERLRGLLS